MSRKKDNQPVFRQAANTVETSNRVTDKQKLNAVRNVSFYDQIFE